jgi:RNA polymerase sigma-70 factor (ECF subfamily)
VQEALLRVHRAVEHGERLESPRAYVATVATRLAIDELRSARVRRERYVGEWLPEPLVGEAPDDPARHAEMADSLSLAFLVLLERLTPEQRAVFLLREVFDYGYGEIAAIIGKTEDNARQLATRARRRVEEGRPRFEASRERRDELARRFFAAAQEGDLPALEALLAEDVVLHGDGGGKVPALARALHGRNRVARTLRNWTRQAARFGFASLHQVDVNGQPGAVLLGEGGAVLSVMALDIADGRIQAIRSIVNPDKLHHVGAAATLGASPLRPPTA